LPTANGYTSHVQDATIIEVPTDNKWRHH